MKFTSCIFAVLVMISFKVVAIPIVSIAPSVGTVELGTSFDLAVDIQGVTDLYAFQFDINFDPATVSLNSVNEGEFLSDTGFTFFFEGINDLVGGDISFIGNTLISPIFGASGDGGLVNFSFDAIATGDSLFDLSNILLLDSAFNDISYVAMNSIVTVTDMVAVPEPSTLALFLFIGLISVGRIFQRKR